MRLLNLKQGLNWKLSLLLISTLLIASCKKPLFDTTCNGPEVKTSIFATGLNNPRGLKFGPDGKLYVAEGGIGGTDSTVGTCMQVPFPVGPDKGSPTGSRISMIDHSGMRSTFADQLPSSINNLGDISGVSDVAFMGNTFYALVAGAGCSHGVPSLPNGVYRINADGSHTMVANLSSWLQSHPNMNPVPNRDDFEPDGDWYSLIVVGQYLYAAEANHQQIVKIDPTNGNISQVADLSAFSANTWSGPTSMVFHQNQIYIGDLTEFPINQGAAKVFRLSSDGSVQVAASGLTTILGLAFDKLGRLYVLETSVGSPFPSPGTGQLVRLNWDGTQEMIATGLSFPTAMTIGSDGKIYISENGYGPTSVGGGQVLRITVKDCNSNSFFNY